MRPNTLRVRLQRQRRREGLRLLTVEMHETAIQAAIARGLLKREESADDWPRLRQLKPLCLPETQNGRQGQGKWFGLLAGNRPSGARRGWPPCHFTKIGGAGRQWRLSQC